MTGMTFDCKYLLEQYKKILPYGPGVTPESTAVKQKPKVVVVLVAVVAAAAAASSK